MKKGEYVEIKAGGVFIDNHLNMYRLEALKLSYEASSNILKLKQSHDRSALDTSEYLKDVFEFADMNLEYIINGSHPSNSEEDTN